MRIELALFGAWRAMQATAQVSLEVPAPATVADLRAALQQHAQTQWPEFRPDLLAASVFASAQCVLRDDEPLPADGQVAVLPPVSGG